MPLYRRREALRRGVVWVAALAIGIAFSLAPGRDALAQISQSESSTTGQDSSDRDDRDRRTSTVKKYRPRDLSIKNTSPFGPGPASPAATATETVTPKASKARTVRKPVTLSRGGSRGGGSLNLQAMVRFNTLLLDPPDETFMAGEEFVTTIVFSNPQKDQVDRIRATLQYNPAFVTPLGVAGIPAKPYLAETDGIKVLDYRESGILTVEAKLANLPALMWIELVQIKWLAVAPALEATIDFINTPDYPSEALKGENPALGSAALEISGLVGGAYQILPSDEEDSESAEQLTENTDPNSYAWAMGEPNKGKAVSLNLRAPKTPLQAGDKFFVDVMLDNPMSARFDALNIVIDFDPAVLQVEDCDHGNWIETGTNIFDGAYHKDFPFDVHYRNQAFNDLGQIHYMVATSKLGHRFPSGKLASILFTALAPNAKAEVRFHVAADPIDNGVMATFLGNNVLAEGDAGVKNAFVKILP